MRQFKILASIFIMLCQPLYALAQTSLLTVVTEAPSSFNSKTAIKLLSEVERQLSKQTLTIDNLQMMDNQINAARDQAKACIKTNEQALNQLNRNLTELNKLKEEETEKNFITDKKQQVRAQLNKCHVFLLRSQQTSDNLDKAILTYTQNLIFKKSSMPLQDLRSLLQQSSNKQFINWDPVKTEIAELKYKLSFGLVLSISLVLLAYWLLRYRLTQLRVHSIISNSSYGWLAVTLIFSLFTLIGIGYFPQSYLCWVSGGLALLGFLQLCIVSLANWLTATAPPGIKSLHIKLIRVLKVFAWISVLGLILQRAYEYNMITPLLAKVLYDLIFLTLCLCLLSIVWLSDRLLAQRQVPIRLNTGLKFLFSALLLGAMLFELLGYESLAQHTFVSTGISVVLVGSMVGFMRLLPTLFHALRHEKYSWQQKLFQQLGLKKGRLPIEFKLIEWLFNVLFYGFILLMALRAWGLPQHSFKKIIASLTNGFQFLNFDIYPAKILVGFVVFITLSFVTRWLCRRVRSSKQHQDDLGAREALATIVYYIGMGAAIITSLLMAGVNFTGLAIIAGALSVGIGFGLQNIVSNFISGIILLIERPIKVGDRIIVGDVEGFVRKISIRSTQVQTTGATDIIVPNSELIANKVTNLMFKDHLFRLGVSVGVAYGTDVDKVREALLAIAENHPEIIKNEKDKPFVSLSQFGENAIIFELWCLLADVNRKFRIKSELNFEIAKTFKAQQIEIAFPQRNIYIKSWPNIPEFSADK